MNNNDIINIKQDIHETTGETKNLKTRLCKNIGQCSFGDACHYAHSIDQLIVVPCAYNNDCIFIKNNEDNTTCNNTNMSKICFFKHPSETIEQYHIRVGNVKSEKTKTPNNIVPIKIDLDGTNPWSTVNRRRKTLLNVESSAEIYVNHTDENITSKIEDLIKNKTNKITLFIDYS